MLSANGKPLWGIPILKEIQFNKRVHPTQQHVQAMCKVYTRCYTVNLCFKRDGCQFFLNEHVQSFLLPQCHLNKNK